MQNDVENRLWSRVRKDGPKYKNLGRCWIWTGATTQGGYGNLFDRVKSKTVYVHRFSWELHYGEIPKGLWVLHRCDNTICVRPSHLFLGTQTDNMQDMVAKNRHLKGEENLSSKLTDKDVILIRQLCESRTMTKSEIAREYGITGKHVDLLVRRKYWKHI